MIDDRRGDASRNQSAKSKAIPPGRMLNSTTGWQTRDVGLATRANKEPWTRGEECNLCAESHPLLSCPTYRSLNPVQRKGVVTAQRRCFVCLKGNHISKECKAKLYDINNCGGMHSRWLHDVQTGPQIPSQSEGAEDSESE